MKGVLEQLVREGLKDISTRLEQTPRDEKKGREEVVIEHPVDLANGDYSTNAALVTAKQFQKSPRDIAEMLKVYIDANKPSEVEKVEVAGAGFVNFYLSKDFFKQSLADIIEKGSAYGKGNAFSGEQVIVEHTDPNPFKEFHIGHLLPNVIGSTVARVFEWNGAEVKQASYQGDVGLHVAKAVWALGKHHAKPTGVLLDDAKTLGQMYAEGAQSFEADTNVAAEIKMINRLVYDRSNGEVNTLYDVWKKVSLDYFESIYAKLGTVFDYYFFESETGKAGKEIVEKNIGEIFEESDGAIVFHAEKYDPTLHTRVFINSDGLPTYEAKELGLAPAKFEKFPYTKSVVVTANEIKDYFRVLLAAMRYVFPELAEKTKHLPHGMLRLPSGKMSSRTGDVITAEWLIAEVKKAIEERGQQATDEIAIGAIKYMILKQSIGNDIVFDVEKSVSTEGDSGPYLQYAYARTHSLLEKADKKGEVNAPRTAVHDVERLLYRFPEVVERAGKEYAPHHITTFLIELSAAFNNFYAHEQVISDDAESPYRLAIVEAFGTVLKNGLTILGIPAPERM